MSYSIGPKIGIDGEAEFRRQIKDINAEYKALEAETRALTAAFEANDDKQGKLKGTAGQLEKQIDAQKRKMKLLEDAVQKASNQYGENTIEATRLRGALYDTQATVAQLENELKDVNRQLDASADSMEEFEQSTEDAGDAALDFKDIVGANFISDVAVDLLHEAADAAVEFAKGMPEAAAEVNAANSQFEQTFGDMEDTARRTLESISDDTGIAVTRMQGDFTKLYAFTKTMGADTEAALDISGRAMLAAADNAAYYDKSIEEATEQLQSFLKGNYENDAALGITATETTRNAKANEMYAMSFDKLSEAQKVDVLLAMVEAGNAASGALGQAAREADSWTNAQGELNEAVTQLQAALGQPALKAAIPIIQDITAAIYELINTSEADKLAEEMDQVATSWEDAEAQFRDTSREIETSAVVAKAYADKLAKLESTGLDTAESQREYANIVQLLNETIPDLNLKIDEQTGLVDKNSAAILASIEAYKEKAKYMAYEEEYTAILNAQAQAQKIVADAEFRLSEIEGQRTGIIDQLTTSTGMEADELIRLYNSQTAVNAAMLYAGDTAPNMAAGFVMAGQSARSLSEEEMFLVAALLELNQEEHELKGTMEDANGTILEQDLALDHLLDVLGAAPAKNTAAAKSQDDVTDSAEATAAAVQALQDEYEAAAVSARESIDSQIGLFDELAAESEMSAAEIVANWQAQQVAFASYASNLEKAVDMGLDQALVQQLSDGSEQSMLILNELVNSTDTNIDEINEAFQGLSAAKDTTAETMAEIRTNANAEMLKLIQDSKTWGVDIVDGATGSISANAYKFNNAMSSLASGGNQSFKNTMMIKSPSRIMIDNSEDTVDGAVVGVERNIRKFEDAMKDLAVAGDMAFLNERVSAAEMYPIVMEMPGYAGAESNSTVNHGGFVINIYQNDGENADELVDRVMDRMQTEIIRRESAL